MQLCQCRDRIRRVLLLSRRCSLRSPEIRSPGTVHRVRLGARGLMFAIPLAMHCSWLLKGTKLVVADNPLKVHLSMSRPYFSKIVMAPGGRRSSLGWEGRVLTGTLGGEKPHRLSIGGSSSAERQPSSGRYSGPCVLRVCLMLTRVCLHVHIHRDTHVWNRWIAYINTCLNMCVHVCTAYILHISDS